MDAALVRKGAVADVRRMVVVLQVDDFRDKMSERSQFAQLFSADNLAVHLELQIGDDGGQVGIADAFTVTVDGALHLSASAAHGRQRIGYAATAVVVAVYAQRFVEVAGNFTHDF